MYENMTVLTNTEYAELVIKAYKYEQLRKKALESMYVSIEEIAIFEPTEEELKAVAERRAKPSGI